MDGDRPVRPADRDGFDHILRPDPEVDPLGALRHVVVARPDGLDVGPCAGAQLDPRANGVAVARGTNGLNGEEVMIAPTVIPHEANLGSTAVVHPQIEIAVTVPVDRGDAASIVNGIEPGDIGDIRESPIAQIEKRAIQFSAAPGVTAAQEAIDGDPAPVVLRVICSLLGRMQRHAPPEEASQVL